ncbi:hypothetical protein XELAEV_18001944mg [Xenopus laevis]|nr:hypothetical protein XELAEV_18001944mg [Xenopus laevis]
MALYNCLGSKIYLPSKLRQSWLDHTSAGVDLPGLRKFTKIRSCVQHRYIDDILMFWEGPVGTLIEFHHILNSVVPTLKFTLCHDMEKLNFLDCKLTEDLTAIKDITSAQLRTPKKTDTIEKESKLAFVSQYLVASDQKNILRKHWQILKTGKRNKNLKDLLVRADIGPQKKLRQNFLGTPQKGTFPCLSCAHCNNVTKGNSFTHPHTAFVGVTTQKVKERIKQHKSYTRCKLLHLLIPAHFHEMKHTVSQLRYQVIDNVEPLRRGGDRQQILKKLEMRWINTLGTLAPVGLNREYTPMLFI